ncbi:hypothetical protein [Desulfofalx alkaliphila]|nr:hypothetical protein [Desulfofalx alkaliphila]
MFIFLEGGDFTNKGGHQVGRNKAEVTAKKTSKQDNMGRDN